MAFGSCPTYIATAIPYDIGMVRRSGGYAIYIRGDFKFQRLRPRGPGEAFRLSADVIGIPLAVKLDAAQPGAEGL